MKMETLLLLTLFTHHPHHALFRDDHAKGPTWEEHRDDYERPTYRRPERYSSPPSTYPSSSRILRNTF